MSEREWSYQVGHGSCGLYVTEVIYRELESKGPLPPSCHWRDRSIGSTGCFARSPTTHRSQIGRTEGRRKGEKKKIRKWEISGWANGDLGPAGG